MKKDYKKLLNDLINTINHEVEHQYSISRKERDDLLGETYFLSDVLGEQVGFNFLISGYKCLKNDQFITYFRMLVEYHSKAAFTKFED